ncbi:hypothetical protein D3C74_350630 [compost metagenome]
MGYYSIFSKSYIINRNILNSYHISPEAPGANLKQGLFPVLFLHEEKEGISKLYSRTQQSVFFSKSNSILTIFKLGRKKDWTERRFFFGSKHAAGR